MDFDCEDDTESAVVFTGRLQSLNPSRHPSLDFTSLAPVTLGRSRDNTLRVPDQRVSSLHATFYFEDGIPFVKDSSTNGTLINGVKLKGATRRLERGDEVLIDLQAKTAMKNIIFAFDNPTDLGGPLFVPSVSTSAVTAKYEFSKELGSGSFGTVWRVRRREDGVVLAAKVIEKKKFMALGAGSAGGDVTGKILEEAYSLRMVQHVNVVAVEDAMDTPSHTVIFLEFAQGGDLEDALEKHGPHLPHATARSCVRQLCSALEYLHGQGMVHRDIKPENVMLAKPYAPGNVPLLKVTDFGLAKVLGPTAVTHTVCGTPLYAAPELFEAARTHAAYGAGVDVWSLGLVAYRLLFGAVPFRFAPGAPSLPEQIRAALRPGWELPLPPQRARVPREAIEFLRAALAPPSRRLTATQALHHPWIREVRMVAAPTLAPKMGESQDSGTSAPAATQAVGAAEASDADGGSVDGGDAGRGGEEDADAREEDRESASAGGPKQRKRRGRVCDLAVPPATRDGVARGMVRTPRARARKRGRGGTRASGGGDGNDEAAAAREEGVEDRGHGAGEKRRRDRLA